MEATAEGANLVLAEGCRAVGSVSAMGNTRAVKALLD